MNLFFRNNIIKDFEKEFNNQLDIFSHVEFSKLNQENFMKWFLIFPRSYFNFFFVDENKDGEIYIDIIKGGKYNNGGECFFITQAYILYTLELLLKNRKNFDKDIGFSIKNLEEFINIILGEDNKIIQYLNYYRERFDYSKNGVDPRDYHIIYIYNICDQLIDWENNKYIQELDKDIFKKMILTTLSNSLIVEYINFK